MELIFEWVVLSQNLKKTKNNKTNVDIEVGLLIVTSSDNQ